MGVFSKYRPHYKIPERITPSIARQNRILGALRENEKLQERFDRLSPVAKSIVNDDGRRLVKDRTKRGPKEASIVSALLNSFKESDFSDPQKRAAYRELRRSQGGQKNVKPSASDRRQYNPTGKNFAATKYGTIARVTGSRNRLGANQWAQAFLTATNVVPCIQRHIRREVMFALKKAGKGYKVKHHRNSNSGVPC